MRILLHHKRTSQADGHTYLLSFDFTEPYFNTYASSECMLAVQFFIGARPGHQRHGLSSAG